MKFTMTAVFEADNLTEAWASAPHVVPKDFRPETIDIAHKEGLLAFSLIGDGREIRADLVGYKPPINQVNSLHSHMTPRGTA